MTAPGSMPPPVPTVHLLVMAGGLGTRARRSDSAPPKQFRQVGGASLLLWGVRELIRAPGVRIGAVVAAVPVAWRPLVEQELAAAALPCRWLLADGGETRTASAWSAARALARAVGPRDADLVAVHDAARPFATRHLLARVATAAAVSGAAVPGVPVTDTIVGLTGEATDGAAAGAAGGAAGGRDAVGEEAGVPARSVPGGVPGGAAGEAPGDAAPLAAYLDRAALRALQTPQAFRWDVFHAAHAWCAERGLDFTDDGGLLAARGCPPVVVMGEPENWKVTTDADLARAEAVLQGRPGG